MEGFGLLVAISIVAGIVLLLLKEQWAIILLLMFGLALLLIFGSMEAGIATIECNGFNPALGCN